MKTTFQKLMPRFVQYRDYTQFLNDNFRRKLLEKLCLEDINTNSSGLAKFLQICMSTLDQIAPRKKNIRGNNMPCFNKEIINYLVHTQKKNATKKSVYQKKILSK